MRSRKRRTSRGLIWGLSAAVTLVFLVGAGLILKALITDDGQKRKRQIQMVTLVKPPPPPKIKENLPEPEVKKEEIIEPEVEEEELPDEMEEQAESDAPAGDDLGLDADGVAGSDGFGLKAKKGGRPLIGGGGGKSQYAWYTRIVRHELEKMVNKILQQNGGVPDGEHEAVIKVVLDDHGTVIQHWVITSSGNQRMDHAINEALSLASISEAPPQEMPRKMKFKISS